MNIYCISIYDENYDFFKSNNLIPVGIGKKKFNSKWLNDNGKKIFLLKMIILENILFIITYGKIIY